MARLLKVFGAINKLLYGKSLEEKLTFGATEEHRLMQNTLCKLGSLKRTIPSDLSDWYHNLVDGLFVMQECTEEYDRYLGELLFFFFTCRSA